MYHCSTTISVGSVRVVGLMNTDIVKVHSRRSLHGSIHFKRREYAVYYYKTVLQLTRVE
jgi:hypothetical protein